MKRKLKNIGLLSIFTILLIGMSFNVIAFGVTSQYWKTRPLIMQPGETKDVSFSLQNMVGDEDVHLLAELKGDKKYVTLTDPSNRYVIPAKTKGVKVNFRITVPADTKIGTTFRVTITFLNAPDSTTQQVGIGTSIGKSLEVIIGNPEAPRIEPTALPAQKTEQPARTGIRPLTKEDIFPAAIIFLLVFFVWLLIKRKKNKPVKKKSSGLQTRKRIEHAPW